MLKKIRTLLSETKTEETQGAVSTIQESVDGVNVLHPNNADLKGHSIDPETMTSAPFRINKEDRVVIF